MATEVAIRDSAPCHNTPPAPSTFDRPFKLIVQDREFLIDSEEMKKMSPVFSVMCYGKDFDGGRELAREIVDEKGGDVDVFLRSVHDNSVINAKNFAVILRLSNKYQVESVIEACQDYIRKQNLDVLKPDEILTLLIAAYEHHCTKDVMVKLVKRMSSETNAVFTRLKISRYLPAQVYGAVMSTTLNMQHLREHDTMNGHCLKMERGKCRWNTSICKVCNKISQECAYCDECKITMCRSHIQSKPCCNDYGKKMVAKLKENVVEFEWQD